MSTEKEPKRKRRGERRKAESLDEASGDRGGVESLRKKESGETEEKAGRCIAERGRKEPKTERRNAGSEMRPWDERHERG